MGRPKKRKRTPPPPTRPGLPFVALFRMFGIGAVSVIACVVALVRHYTLPPEPMLVPSPPATEVPAPDLELVPVVGPGAPEALPSVLPGLVPALAPPPPPSASAPSR